MEPFASSLSVLLARDVVPVVRETVNDNDKALMTFWKVLRERTDELVFQCSLTPHGREQREGDAVLNKGLEALWRAWEFLRLEGATGMSVWWRDHADHHMSVLLSADGPFKSCSPDDGHKAKLLPLPCEEPPEGLF
ncbi:protein of unknown function [Arthrobacter alpinus]|uniref:DUF4913 domain-containing protein n=1 Tax=Arthrobacter alpinus TaxID=656366 RepID=A0A1H5PF95_9MICC|nr:protein of unknown function [Arthrobacter alpinus]